MGFTISLCKYDIKKSCLFKFIYSKKTFFFHSEESHLFQEQLETFKMNSTMLDEHNKVLVKDNEEQLNTVMKENQDRLRFVNFMKK